MKRRVAQYLPVLEYRVLQPVRLLVPCRNQYTEIGVIGAQGIGSFERCETTLRIADVIIKCGCCTSAGLRFRCILGEETNDLPSSYSAAEQFTLNHTGIQVHYPKSWFVRPNGDVALRGVIPDIAIATPVVETDEDVVLHEALRIVRGKQ